MDCSTTLLNDILDFSKIEAGQLHVEETAFDLLDLLDNVVDTFALPAREKRLLLVNDVDASVPARLIGDPTRLRQIVVNLVSNAIKFTHTGEVRLRTEPLSLPSDVSAGVSAEGDSVSLKISVEDTGVGIAHAQQAAIFDAFVQADSSIAREYGGTGLGLSISASLVQLMGGRIWLESEPACGSRFQFSLPFGIEATSPKRPRRSENPLSGCRVLICERHPATGRALAQWIRRWGGAPVLIASRPEAETALSQGALVGQPFRLLLAEDASTAQALKAREVQPPGRASPSNATSEPAAAGSVAVVAIRSPRWPDALDTHTHTEASTPLIAKPIRHRELKNAISGLVALSAHETEAETVSQPDHAEQTRCLRILLVEDNPVNQRVATALLRKLGHQSRIANNGYEAIEAVLTEWPDLILMDVEMPEMDGLEATRRIRAIERSRAGQLPIIALTAHAMKGHREQFLAAGMDGYVSKPIRSAELNAEINALMPAQDADL